MERSTKDAWLNGPGDLKEADVEDVPVPGQTVRVRGLPASASNQASSEALVYKQVGLDQMATIDTGKLEVIQFAAGCVDPSFTLEEAQRISEKYGPAFNKVVRKIDELSGVDKEAIAEANARFQAGGASPNGSDVGDEPAAGGAGPDLPPRAGARTEDAGR